jgi:hypothetical protein
MKRKKKTANTVIKTRYRGESKGKQDDATVTTFIQAGKRSSYVSVDGTSIIGTDC